MAGIHAIGGMAGVGKTTFAVRAAHRLAREFPGGQFFLPLHERTPGQQPVDPRDALASLLLSARVPAAQILPRRGTDGAVAGLAGRQPLLMLDDAASREQVLPMLPGTGRSLVLVTSWRHLTALDDATTISLDILPPDEAAGLPVRRCGRSSGCGVPAAGDRDADAPAAPSSRLVRGRAGCRAGGARQVGADGY